MYSTRRAGGVIVGMPTQFAQALGRKAAQGEIPKASDLGEAGFRKYVRGIMEKNGGAERHIATAKNDGYISFGIGYSLFSGILNRELVQSLQEGGTMLSVGAGACLLESFLVDWFGISPRQFTVADIDWNRGAFLHDYNRVEMDMFGAWPRMEGEKFGRIVFQESIGYALLGQDGMDNERGMAKNEILPGTKMRLDALANAARKAAPGGRILVCGDHTKDGEMEKIIAALEAEFPGIRMVKNALNKEFAIQS